MTICEHGIEGCVMPGWHLPDECHTAEMLEAQYEEMNMDKIVFTEKQFQHLLREICTGSSGAPLRSFTPDEAAHTAARIGGPHQLEIQRALTEMRRTGNG